MYASAAPDIAMPGNHRTDVHPNEGATPSNVDIDNTATPEELQRARLYVQCAGRARRRQRERLMRGTFPVTRDLHRLTGIESANIAAYRREAAFQEHMCAIRATTFDLKHQSGDERHQDTTSPLDTAQKNAHRADRYKRLVDYLDDKGIAKASIDKRPWCVDSRLNLEEEGTSVFSVMGERARALFVDEDETPRRDLEHRTNRDVGWCITKKASHGIVDV